ncbi:MAG: cytochrome P450 [Haloarculaceae archaeon]
MASSTPTAGTRPASAVPGPAGLPLVGNTLAFLRDPVGFYDELAAYDSDVVAYNIAGDDGYMVRNPEDVQRVLVTDASDYRRAQVIHDSLGQVADGGLFLTEGEAWHRERTALQPAFYRDRIETYAEMMVRYASERADAWQGRDAVAVSEEMRTLTLEVLTKTLLDVDIRGRESEIGDAAETITANFDAGTVSAFLPMWVPTPQNRRAKRALAAFDETIESLVAQRRAGEDDPDDLLSILLDVEFEDGSGLSERDVRDNLFTFLVAGHETTALTLSYACMLLANHPERQAKLHAELDGVLGDEKPTAASLFDLDYLGHVVDEALRLYPPAYTIFREPTSDVTLGGYEIPAGSIVTLPQWVVHRDGRWFDDPDAFRPERWAGDRDRPEYAYFPFGGGPRHCIGMRFALMEAKLVLATLAQRFEFEPGTEPPIDLSMRLTLQPSDPIAVELAGR